MKLYKKIKSHLEKTFNYRSEMEHDACGVGLIATTNGKKSRKVVEYGIEALKAIWHRVLLMLMGNPVMVREFK